MSARYNGWKNYQTWNVALWISNDEGLYRLALGCRDYDEFRSWLRDDGITETPDQVSYNDSGLDFDALDALIREMHGEGEEEDE